jgi:hypothetical protein
MPALELEALSAKVSVTLACPPVKVVMVIGSADAFGIDQGIEAKPINTTNVMAIDLYEQ